MTGACGVIDGDYGVWSCGWMWVRAPCALLTFIVTSPLITSLSSILTHLPFHLITSSIPLRSSLSLPLLASRVRPLLYRCSALPLLPDFPLPLCSPCGFVCGPCSNLALTY